MDYFVRDIGCACAFLWLPSITILRHATILVNVIALAPCNIPPDQDNDCRDDGRQKDESTEGAQRHDRAQIQAGRVRLLLVIVHRQGHVHVGSLVRPASANNRKKTTFNFHSLPPVIQYPPGVTTTV